MCHIPTDAALSVCLQCRRKTAEPIELLRGEGWLAWPKEPCANFGFTTASHESWRIEWCIYAAAAMRPVAIISSVATCLKFLHRERDSCNVESARSSPAEIMLKCTKQTNNQTNKHSFNGHFLTGQWKSNKSVGLYIVFHKNVAVYLWIWILMTYT